MLDVLYEALEAKLVVFACEYTPVVFFDAVLAANGANFVDRQ